MTATIKSSLIINIVSGTGVTLDGPPVPAISADSIYNPQNPSQTLTEMLDLVAADAASAQEDAEKALANSVATPSLVTGSPPRPGEAPNLFGQTKAGSIDKTVLINPKWVETSTSGNVIRVHAPTGHAPQTIAPIAPVDLDSGQFYFVRWRVQRQINSTDFSPVIFGIYWMDADKKGLDGGTTIVADIPLVVDDGVQEVSIMVGSDNPPDIVAPEGAAYFRPFIDLYGNTHVTDIIALETHDSVGMLPDASNATLSAAMNNISAGRITMDEGLLTKLNVGLPNPAFFANVPLSVVTAAPVISGSDPAGGSVALMAVHDTGTTPARIGMYGGYFNATQNIAAATDIPNDYVGYVGAVVQGVMHYSEGGFDTTVTAPAIHGDLTLTVADATKLVPGTAFVIVHDRGSTEGNVVVSRAGKVLTLQNIIDWPVSPGAVVYSTRGTVRGLSGQSTTHDGVSGVYQFTAELATQSAATARPHARGNLLLGVNALNQSNAIGPYEAGLMLSAASGAVPLKNGIAFTTVSGQHFVSPTGTLIKAFGGAFANGTDYSLADFSGNAFASPGFRVDGDGTPHIENTSPTLVFQDTNQAPEAGLWRMTMVPSTGQMVLQENLAPAGDWSSSRILWLLDTSGYGRLNGPNPGLWLNDQNGTPTAGGLWRMYGASGQLAFQTNTAIAQDFSSSITALSMTPKGALRSNSTYDQGPSLYPLIPFGNTYASNYSIVDNPNLGPTGINAAFMDAFNFVGPGTHSDGDITVGRFMSTQKKNWNNPAVFVGSIFGTTLTVTSFTSGQPIIVNMGISGQNNDIPYNTKIAALGTGTGATGTYTISASMTVPSETIYGDVFGQQVIQFITMRQGLKDNSGGILIDSRKLHSGIVGVDEGQVNVIEGDAGLIGLDGSFVRSMHINMLQHEPVGGTSGGTGYGVKVIAKKFNFHSAFRADTVDHFSGGVGTYGWRYLLSGAANVSEGNEYFKIRGDAELTGEQELGDIVQGKVFYQKILRTRDDGHGGTFAIRDHNDVVDLFSLNSFGDASFRLTLAIGGDLTISHPTDPTINFFNRQLTPTTGQIWRFVVSTDGAAAAQVNTAPAGDYSSNIIPLFLTCAGDALIAGASTTIPTTSTNRLLFIPTMTGPPTGVPEVATVGRTAFVWNSGTKQLHVYDQASGRWFSSAVFT